MRQLKVVIVGDGAVGKTCLLWSFMDGRKPDPDEYEPTVFDNMSKMIEIDGEHVTLNLWDTAGQEAMDRLRIISYDGADIFIVCFAVNSEISLENIQAQWIPEIRKNKSDSKLVLVATKTDLRSDQAVLESLSQQRKFILTKDDGLKMSKQINAAAYLECSAMTHEGVDEVFKKVALVALAKDEKRSSPQCCSLI